MLAGVGLGEPELLGDLTDRAFTMAQRFQALVDIWNTARRQAAA